MFRVNFNGYEEMHKFAVLSQFQATANNLINNYDFNDIKSAVAHAKANTEVGEEKDFNGSIKIINELFFKAMTWLEKNGRRV